MKIAEARRQVGELIGKVKASLAEGEKTAFEIVGEIVGAENVNTPVSAWVLQIVLSCLDHLTILGEVQPVERNRSPALGPSVACGVMASFTIVREVAAPPETIFEVLTDHRAYSSITPLRRSELEREGDPAPNGAGAIRVLGAVGPPLREEVLTYEAPTPLLLQAALGAAGPRPRRDGRADPQRRRHEDDLRACAPSRPCPLVGGAVVGVVKLGVKQLIDGVSAEAERRASA